MIDKEKIEIMKSEILYLFYVEEMCVKNIGKLLNINSQRIYEYFKKNNIKLGRLTKNRKYQLNEKFFNTWSHEMAYILGFITADGNISGNLREVIITLNSKDRCILEFIKSSIGSTAPIVDFVPTGIFANGDYHSKFTICSGYIVDVLMNHYKLLPAKSGKESLDFNIPKEFVGSYTRGFFDGDGCVCYYKGKHIITSIVCSCHQYLEDLRKLNDNLGIVYKATQKKMWTWSLGQRDSLELRDKMYEHDCFSLIRKKEKYYNYDPPRRIIKCRSHKQPS